MIYESYELNELFDRIEATVNREGAQGFTALPMAFALHDAAERSRKFENAADDDYFQEMVRVVFSSGMPAHLANERLAAFYRRFSDYRAVAEFDNQFVVSLLSDPDLVMHDRKIRRVIAMAKSFRYIVAQYGSFSAYLNSKGNKDAASAMEVRADLMKRFTYLGRFTSLLFLVQVGYPILKPDRALIRVFERLRLVATSSKPASDDQNHRLTEGEIVAALKAGSRLAEATGKPIHYINMILLAFAQGGDPEFLSQAICTSQRPRCSICGAKDQCRFTDTTKLRRNSDIDVLISSVVYAPGQARTLRA